MNGAQLCVQAYEGIEKWLPSNPRMLEPSLRG